MLNIPTQPVPHQILSTLLGQQDATITIRQLSTGLFLSLSLGDRSIVSQVICEDANLIVRGTYQGFVGDLCFVDMTGQGADPVFTELGTRFQLVYLTADEAVTFG